MNFKNKNINLVFINIMIIKFNRKYLISGIKQQKGIM